MRRRRAATGYPFSGGVGAPLTSGGHASTNERLLFTRHRLQRVANSLSPKLKNGSRVRMRTPIVNTRHPNAEGRSMPLEAAGSHKNRWFGPARYLFITIQATVL